MNIIIITHRSNVSSILEQTRTAILIISILLQIPPKYYLLFVVAATDKNQFKHY